jgi:biotin carboxyl carrier protein
MLNRVRKFLKNHSPDWLNVEVNKDLLQNLSVAFSEAALGAIAPTQTPLSSTSYDENCSPRPELGEGLGVRAKTQPASKRSTLLDSDRPISTDLSPNGENCLQFPTPGTPHWRRIRQVFQTLDNAPQFASYNQLIEYVKETTGVGCSRKLISKWKKQNKSQGSDRNSEERHLEKSTPAIAFFPTSIPSTLYSFQFTETSNHSTKSDLLSTDNCSLKTKKLMTDDWSLMTVKAWSYLTAAAGITLATLGCELIPLNSNRPNENIAIANVTAPLTPLPEIPERRKNQLEPRNIKIELTLSNPQDLKVKPGDKISAGQVLSDRTQSRNRLQAKKKQLQLSLAKLNLPLTPIPFPKPIPEISQLPPVSYAQEEAAIKLHKQKLKEAERAIANQQEKINQIRQLLSNSTSSPVSRSSGDAEGRGIGGTEGDRTASPSYWLSGGGNLQLILSHEQANLKNLETAKKEAQIQLEVAQSQLTTAKENRAYAEYQRQLEQTRRAIALQQQNQARQRTESERARLLAEREYSKAQIETQIQALDSQIDQLSTVTAPYEGTIKKVKWTGQSDHNLTVELTLDIDSVTSQQSTVISDTESVDSQ